MSPLYFFGDKKSKNQRRRETLAENQAMGRAAERLVTLRKEIWWGKDNVVRSPRGQDIVVKERNPWTGRTKTIRYEIKSGKSKLSKLQLETKKRHPRSYKVERTDPPFY